MGKTLEKGTQLEGGRYPYVVEKTLGQGGFGITYLATANVKIVNVTAKVKFAVKEHFLSEDCERESGSSRVVCSKPATERVENSRKDFMAEAKRLQSIAGSHPSLVRVNEVFEENNTAYYVMEHLDGMTLKAYVAKSKGGRLDEEETMALLKPVIEAVGILHENDMTHLDIKPENIMIAKDDDGRPRPVLIDFGLSKHYSKDGKPTSTINILGSSDGYSPTEQYAGITTFSPEADVYALGATIYFCLTGETPKKSTELQDGELAGLLKGKISDELVDILARATKPSKFDREKNVRALIPVSQKPGARQIADLNNKDEKKKEQQKEDHNQVTPIKPDVDRSNLWKAIVGIGVLAVVGLGIWFLASGKAEKGGTFDDDEEEIIAEQERDDAPVEVVSVTDMEWSSPLGKALYSGAVETDSTGSLVPHGSGVATITDGPYKGSIYDGEFNQGNMEGRSTYTLADGDVFEGIFKNNEYYSGKYTSKSTGYYFEGTFKNQEPDNGKWYDKTGKEL